MIKLIIEWLIIAVFKIVQFLVMTILVKSLIPNISKIFATFEKNSFISYNYNWIDHNKCFHWNLQNYKKN